MTNINLAIKPKVTQKTKPELVKGIAKRCSYCPVVDYCEQHKEMIK